MISAENVSVREYHISQNLQAGLYADWHLKAVHLVSLNPDVNTFIAPSAVFSANLSFPVTGFNTSFQLTRGTEHPGMYLAANSNGHMQQDTLMRLMHVGLDYHRGQNRVIQVNTSWRAFPDPNSWVWEKDFSLVGEQTRFDVNGNEIIICGKAQAVDTRFAEESLRGIRRYVDPADNDIEAVATQLRNRINSEVFFGRPPEYWLCTGPRVTPVDDVHVDIDVGFVGREKGWNPVFPCPGPNDGGGEGEGGEGGQSGGGGQSPADATLVQLHHAADFNILLGTP